MPAASLNEETLLRIREVQLDALHQAYQSLNQAYDSAQLHALRLAFKQLDALYAFLEFAGKEKYRQAKHFREWKSLFRESGKVRDREIREQLLQQWGIPPPQPNPDKKLRREQRFQRALKRAGGIQWGPSKAKSGKWIYELRDDLSPQYEKWLQRLRKRIHRKFSAAKNASAYHDLRKEVKYLLFALGWMQESHPEIPKLKAIAQSLGEWHDLYVLQNNAAEFSPEIQSRLNLRLTDVSTQAKALLDAFTGSQRDE